MALGADRAGVLQLIVREGMTVGIAGIIVGILAADRDQPGAVSARVRRLGLGSRTYVGVSGTLAVVALVSCVVPAVRAARVDPMEALRLD